MKYVVSFVSLYSNIYPVIVVMLYVDGIVQERHNSIVLAVELCLFCNNPSMYYYSIIGLVKNKKFAKLQFFYFHNLKLVFLNECSVIQLILVSEFSQDGKQRYKCFASMDSF